MACFRHHGRYLIALITLQLQATTAVATAHASEPGPGRLDVRTRDGVEFVLPGGFHERPLKLTASGHTAELEHAYDDTGVPPIEVFVTRDASQPNRSLPPASAAVVQDYSAGFVQGLTQTVKLGEVVKVTPGTYDPARAAFSIAVETRRGAAVSSVASIAFFTRNAIVQVLVVAPSVRAHDVSAIAAAILASSHISPGSMLEVSMFHDLEDMSAFTIGRLLGAIVGPSLGVLLLGGLLALLLTRVGTSPSLAAICGCALTVLTYASLGLMTGDLSIFVIVQLASAVLWSLLLLRPMRNWLVARQRNPA